MQDLILQVSFVAIFAVGVGSLSSMIGIGGGVLNTPLLLIVFWDIFDEQSAPSTALVGALAVSIAGSIVYWQQKPRPMLLKPGLILAVFAAPGSLFGVMLRTLIETPYVLRLIFGISLMPIALKMLFAKKKGKGDLASEMGNWNSSHITPKRWIISLIGAFVGGVSAGLLGIGGGAIIVPVLTSLMGVPMHAAAATSMLTMIFTTSAGTAYNMYLNTVNLYFATALAIGMLIGGQVGSRLACKVNAAQLKQIFGLFLVLPLITMMRLGQIWLDPDGTRGLLSIMGDFIIWLAIVVPVGLLRLYQIRKQRIPIERSEPCELPTSE